MHLRVTSGQFIYMYVSFRSEVVITRFNRRKERVLPTILFSVESRPTMDMFYNLFYLTIIPSLTV